MKQDIPIRLLRTPDVEALREPMCPDPDIHIVFPDLANIRTVMTALKNVTNVVTVSANGKGTLQFTAKADEAILQTEYTLLRLPDVAKPPNTGAGT